MPYRHPLAGTLPPHMLLSSCVGSDTSPHRVIRLAAGNPLPKAETRLLLCAQGGSRHARRGGRKAAPALTDTAASEPAGAARPAS